LKRKSAEKTQKLRRKDTIYTRNTRGNHPENARKTRLDRGIPRKKKPQSTARKNAFRS
jgi:hypothetical protein